MTAVRAAIGGVVAGIGVWTLADIPIVNPLPAILLGWVLLGVGLAILVPALVDLLVSER